MTDRAIIDGSLVDVRNVNQHKCVRLIIDVPAERARQVIDAFGWPTMVSPVSVAIARLVPEAASQEPRSASLPVEPAGADKPYSYAKQLGMLCGDTLFWRFLHKQLRERGMTSIHITSEDDAADGVRYLCGVQSRRDAIAGTEAGEIAFRLITDFKLWRDGAAA